MAYKPFIQYLKEQDEQQQQTNVQPDLTKPSASSEEEQGKEDDFDPDAPPSDEFEEKLVEFKKKLDELMDGKLSDYISDHRVVLNLSEEDKVEVNVGKDLEENPEDSTSEEFEFDDVKGARKFIRHAMETVSDLHIRKTHRDIKKHFSNKAQTDSAPAAPAPTDPNQAGQLTPSQPINRF